MAPFTTIIVSARRPRDHVAGALYVSMSQPEVWRDGARCRASNRLRRALIILGARPGAIVSMDDLVEMLWGDDPHGGPEAAASNVSQAIKDLRFICAALGLVLSTHGGRGWSLRAKQWEAA